MEASPFFSSPEKTYVVRELDDFDCWLENADDSKPLTALRGISVFPAERNSKHPGDLTAYMEPTTFCQTPTAFTSADDIRLFLNSPSGSFSTNALHIPQHLPSPERLSTPTPTSPPVRPRFTAINQHAQPSRNISIIQHVLDTTLDRALGRPLENPLATPNHNKDISLLSTSVLPDKLRSLFSFRYFNAMQTKAFHPLYESDENVVLSAPTGSGKTVIYIGPTKSLCQERAKDWKEKFVGLGVRCRELTGDTDAEDTVVLRETDIVITTPEKWDAITRKRKDHAKVTDPIRLLLIDEVHLLGDDRGAVLEVVAARMKLRSLVRFVAVSATVPNIHDVGVWIGQGWSEGVPATTLAFGEEYRPVKLERHCYGYPQSDNESDFQFDNKLNNELMEIIQRHSNSKPTLIFCSTRKSAQQAAQTIVRQYNVLLKAKMALPWAEREEPTEFVNSALKGMTRKRVAYHHAGLDPKDRASIENLYRTGKIAVLCCTSTLAAGVNLPAHLVIIKNTQAYIRGQMVELEETDILQMIGRAGRPQFDDKGVAVILTCSDKHAKYKHVVDGKRPLESRLHLQLIEHVNAEIGLGTIQDIQSAKRWLRSTFFFVRCLANPHHYDVKEHPEAIESMLEEKCLGSIRTLECEGLVENIDGNLRTTVFGDVTAKYYIRLQTIAQILRTSGAAKLKDVLETVCKADEFNCLRLRSGEKAFYNHIVNQNYAIRFPFKSTAQKSQPVEYTWQKVSLLIQAELGFADFGEREKQDKHRQHFASMTQDRLFVFHHAQRIAKCMRDCLLHRKDATSLLSIITLERCLYAHCWHDGPGLLKQLPGIGAAYVRLLAFRGISTFEGLRRVQPEELELWCNRSTPFGRNLLIGLENIPQYQLNVYRESHQVVNSPQRAVLVIFRVRLMLLNAKIIGDRRNVNKSNWTTFLATMEGAICAYQTFLSSSIGTGKELKFEVMMTAPSQAVRCYVVCEGIVGCEVEAACDPGLDERALAEVNSIVLRQPTISQLVNEATRAVTIVTEPPQRRELNNMQYKQDTLAFAGRDLDFKHLHEASGKDVDTQPPVRSGPNPKRKRANVLEDRFSDIEIEDFELDVNDLKELECIELPTKLLNGNVRCNHPCKDRKKCGHLCCKEGRLSKRTKNRTPISKAKKSTLVNSFDKDRPNRMRGETSQVIRKPIATTIEDVLSIDEIVEASKPKTTKVIEASSNSNPSQLSWNSRAAATTFKGVSQGKLTSPQGPNGVSRDFAYDQLTLPMCQKTNVRSTLGTKGSRPPEEESDDDGELPMPEELPRMWMSKKGVGNEAVGLSLQAQDNHSWMTDIVRETSPTDVQAKKSDKKHETDVVAGFRFSVEDILECVDIV